MKETLLWLTCLFFFLAGCKAVSGLGQSVGDLSTSLGSGDAAGVSTALTDIQSGVGAVADGSEDFFNDDTALVAGLTTLVAGAGAWYLKGKQKDPA